MAKRLRLVAALLLIAALPPLVDAAHAEIKLIALKHVSYNDLKSKCDAAGGKFDSVGKSDYWCQTKDGSSVTCNAEKCTGTTKAADMPTSTSRQQLGDPTTATEMLMTE